MGTHDALFKLISIVSVGIGIETRESLVVVGDIKATVRGTLHGREYSSTAGSTLNSNIQITTEGLLLSFLLNLYEERLRVVSALNFLTFSSP
jgi:hypothetical protein